MSERLLKDDEAATMVGSTPKTLAVWRCQQKGPKITYLGRGIRYKLSDLEEFIRNLKTSQTKTTP